MPLEAGCVNIDNTSHFRMDPNVPLVVPEVNGEALKDHHGIISCPNCTTIMMCSALTRLNDEFDIERIVVSTLPSCIWCWCCWYGRALSSKPRSFRW